MSDFLLTTACYIMITASIMAIFMLGRWAERMDAAVRDAKEKEKSE